MAQVAQQAAVVPPRNRTRLYTLVSPPRKRSSFGRLQEAVMLNVNKQHFGRHDQQLS